MNNNCFSDHRCICVTTNASLLKSVSPITGKVQQYSFSQANVESLRLSFAQNFFSYVLPQNETFIRNWLFYFFSILNEFIPKKRSRRQQYPPYYSSHSIHLLNQLRTLQKRKDMNNRVESSLREKLSISLELDTVVFLEAFTSHNKTGLNMCYKLIESLSNCTDIPLEVTWDDATASGYDQVANLFNPYFVSVFNKSSKQKVSNNLLKTALILWNSPRKKSPLH